MRRIMGLATAGVLWLGMSSAADAQFSLSIGNPYAGGISIGAPYGGLYGSGLYGGYGNGYYPVQPGATYYGSGYSGFVPGASSYAYPGYYPAAGLGYVGGYRPNYGYAPYRYGYYGGYGGYGGLRGFRRGFVGGIW